MYKNLKFKIKDKAEDIIQKKFSGKPSFSELQKRFHAALKTNYRKDVC